MLRQAADSYDRAARAPYGRIPAPGQPGNNLRRTARLLSTFTSVLADAPLTEMTLLMRFARLAEAICELREAQGLAAQPAAARRAAEHLRAAMPGSVTPPSSRRTRVRASAERSRAEFPFPPGTFRPGPGSPGEADSQPTARPLLRPRRPRPVWPDSRSGSAGKQPAPHGPAPVHLHVRPGGRTAHRNDTAHALRQARRGHLRTAGSPGLAAQPAAARRAAEHLRAAMPGSVTPPSSRRTRVRASAERSRAEFPFPPGTFRPGPGSPGEADSQPTAPFPVKDHRAHGARRGNWSGRLNRGRRLRPSRPR